MGNSPSEPKLLSEQQWKPPTPAVRVAQFSGGIFVAATVVAVTRKDTAVWWPFVLWGLSFVLALMAFLIGRRRKDATASLPSTSLMILTVAVAGLAARPIVRDRFDPPDSRLARAAVGAWSLRVADPAVDSHYVQMELRGDGTFQWRRLIKGKAVTSASGQWRIQDRILSLTATESQSSEPAWSGNTLTVGTVEKADEWTLAVKAGNEGVTYLRR